MSHVGLFAGIRLLEFAGASLPTVFELGGLELAVLRPGALAFGGATPACARFDSGCASGEAWVSRPHR